MTVRHPLDGGPEMADVKDLREKMANIATEARSKLSEVKDDTPEERAA